MDGKFELRRGPQCRNQHSNIAPVEGLLPDSMKHRNRRAVRCSGAGGNDQTNGSMCCCPSGHANICTVIDSTSNHWLCLPPHPLQLRKDSWHRTSHVREQFDWARCSRFRRAPSRLCRTCFCSCVPCLSTSDITRGCFRSGELLAWLVGESRGWCNHKAGESIS
jgi:hypothetical protein